MVVFERIFQQLNYIKFNEDYFTTETFEQNLSGSLGYLVGT